MVQSKKQVKNLFSVDFEEWYTSAYLRHDIKDDNNKKSIISTSTIPILELLKKHNTTATFFVIGSVAEKNPEVIEKIHSEGHEIASHGYSHKPLFWLTKEDFEDEVNKTNRILYKITKEKVRGFRAPYFSIDKKHSWGIDVLRKNGFYYDSSIFPAKTPLYGEPDAPTVPYKPSQNNILIHDEKSDFVEYPMTVYKFIGKTYGIPLCGGFYGRALPVQITKFLAQKINAKGQSLNFYFHPWETDSNTPRIDVSLKKRFITYYGINSYLKKIESLLKSFDFESFRDNYEREWK